MLYTLLIFVSAAIATFGLLTDRDLRNTAIASAVSIFTVGTLICSLFIVNEGAGIALMMAELPDDFSVGEMVSMIQANAAKSNAEAFLRSVENGNPNITVVTGGPALPVTVTANTGDNGTIRNETSANE
jgi:hypothetical protein